MTPQEHYQLARLKAGEVRSKYEITSPRVMVSDLKKIYKAEGIQRVDYYDGFKSTRIRGAYFNDDAGCSVMINKKLIRVIDPKIFTLAHELKHHLMDEVHAVSLCSNDNEHIIIERAADAFASELIYPTSMFVADLRERAIAKGMCTPEDVVRLKHETKTTLSHTGIALRVQRLGYGLPENFNSIKWDTLRDELYPEYKFFRTRQKRVAVV